MSEVKRMRYFKEEFLKNEDFIDEQEYHRRMRYRHNRDFHTWGIGDGLEVTFTPGDHRVDISPGIAVDGEGKEIILEEPQILDFSKAGYEGGKSYYVTITWSQEEGEPKQENEAKRWVETPGINTSKTLPAQPELVLVLAQVTLNLDRTIAAVDDPGRRYAQIGIPDGSVTEAKLADNAVTSVKIKDGSVGTSTLSDKAVTRAKIGDSSVNEEKLSTSVQAKLVTNGDNHTHSAGDIGALPDTGGIVNGNLQVKGDVNITNVIDFGDTTDWNDHWRFTHQWITPGDLVIDRRVAGTYVGPYLTITTSGRVGIGPGAGTPEETLHVNGSVRGNQEGGALRINTRNGYVDIGPQDQSYSHFTTDRETFYFNKRVMIDGGEIGSSSGQDMKLQTGGETRVTIKQDNGNVGINTLAPEGALHVKGHNATAYFESDGNEAHLILRTIEGAANHVHIVNRPGGRAAIRAPRNDRPEDAFNVLANGNVGVRTEVPDSTLSVVAGRAVDFPLDGNQIAAAFYGSPGSNGRPIVVVNRGNKGEDGVNYGPLISFLFHGGDVGRITVNENGALSYLPFTGSHLGWSKETLEQNILVSMTGNNKTMIEDVPESEPLYGVAVTKTKNDKKVLGTVFSTEEEQILVAAVGNHFIWVADKGEDIEVGDALISSDVAGHAEKDPEEDKYSYVIGRASENVKWDEVKDTIEIEGKKVKHKLISVLFGFHKSRNG